MMAYLLPGVPQDIAKYGVTARELIRLKRLRVLPDKIGLDNLNLDIDYLAKLQGCGPEDKEWTCLLSRTRDDCFKLSGDKSLPAGHERHLFHNKVWQYVASRWQEVLANHDNKRQRQPTTSKGNAGGKGGKGGRGGRSGKGKGSGNGTGNGSSSGKGSGRGAGTSAPAASQ